MATVTNVHDLARAHLGDVAKEIWTDAVLLDFSKPAYRKVQRALRASGMPLIHTVQSAVLTIPASTVTIGRLTTPALPGDLLRPRAIRTKLTASGAYKVISKSEVFISDEAAVATPIDRWDWRGDFIYLSLCSAECKLQMIYEASLTDLAAVGDTLGIPDILDAMAAMVASFACASRDELADAKNYMDLAMSDLGMIAKGEIDVSKAIGKLMGAQ
jgi:hypothetical protein